MPADTRLICIILPYFCEARVDEFLKVGGIHWWNSHNYMKPKSEENTYGTQ